MNIATILQHRAAQDSDALAYRFLPNDKEELVLSYHALLSKASSLADKLSANKLAGQRVLLVYPPGLDFITAFFACLLARAIPVPLPLPRVNDSTQRLQHVMKDCDPALIFTTFASLVPVLSQLSDTNRHIVVATDVASDVVHGNVVPRLSACSGTPDIAFIQYTSGSTSLPKGVLLSHENLCANLKQIEQTFEHRRDSAGVIWLPHFHDMGLIGGILEPLFVGFPVTLFSPLSFLQRPLRWLQLIDKYRATTSGGPNFAYELCVSKARTARELPDIDLSCWKTAFNGAEPVRAKTLRAFSEIFSGNGFNSKAFLPCYGLAEATLLVTAARLPSQFLETSAFTANETANDAPLSCGVPAEATKIQIVRVDSDLVCVDGEIGEICVQGASISRGYWGRPMNESAFSNGIGLRTGDLGYLQDGQLFITSRLKDLIIIRGKNIYPNDVEETAREAEPSLKTEGAAAVGISYADGEGLVLLQEVSARTLRQINMRSATESIREFVLERHGVSLKDFVLLPAGTLPRTSSGKISRSSCRQLYMEQAFRSLLVEYDDDSHADDKGKICSVRKEPKKAEIENLSAVAVDV